MFEMGSVNILDLPPRYQRQALAKLAQGGKARDAPRENKYHNQPTVRMTENASALRFDSKKEARRYDALMVQLRAGEICDLRLQVDFTLQEAYTAPDGQRVRAIRYKADFTYRRGSEYVVEDVKSRATRTDKYAIKRKMMMDKFGISIQEV